MVKPDLQRNIGTIQEPQGPFAKPFQEKLAVMNALWPIVRRGLAAAKRLPQYILWHDNANTLATGAYENAWFGDFHPTARQILEQHFDSRMQSYARYRGKMIEHMRSVLKQEPIQENMISVVIRKKGMFGFHMLARFPEGKVVSDAVDVGSNLQVQDANRQDTIYFTPTAACTLQAASDLFEQHKRGKQIAVVQIPYMSEIDVSKVIFNGSPSPVIEYAPESGKKTPPKLFLLACLQGIYTNETRRIRISDFWNAQQPRRRQSSN